MAVPTDTLWERDPHTEAKHRLLNAYLAAWFPILAKQYQDQGITYVDGFAGPGEYLNSTDSSPSIALRHAIRGDVLQYGTMTRLVFMEDRADRLAHLNGVLEGLYPSADRSARVEVRARHGKCEIDLLNLLTQVGAWSGPVFANMDGWGVDTPYDIVRRIGGQHSSEVLVTFQDSWFMRFATLDHLPAGDLVFGDQSWRAVADQPTSQKRAFLVTEYRNRLHAAGFPYTLSFELLDEGGHALYLMFGTSNIRGVEKMKEALWSVDPVAGPRFRDPRDPNQLELGFGDALDLRPLRTAFMAELHREGRLDLEALAQFALLETMYLRTHAKPAIDGLISDTIVEQVGNGRRYSEKVFRLTNGGLAAPAQLGMFG